MDRPPNVTLEELLSHAGWVRELAIGLVGDAATADDLVQETWVAAMRHRPAGDKPARPWLARVMRNLARDRWRGEERRRRREMDVARAEAMPSSTELAGELEMQRALGTALTELDDSLQNVLIRRYFHGSSAAEIAEIERISERTVRDRLERGIATLRSKLDRSYGDRSTWAALLLPIARRAGVSANSPNASATVPVGLLTSTVVWKGIAATTLAVALAGWFATRGLAHRGTATSSMQSRLVADQARSPDGSPAIAAGASGQRASVPPNLDDTQLTVRVVNARTRESISEVPVRVLAVRPHTDLPDAPPRSGEEVELANGKTDAAGEIGFRVLAGIPLRVEQSGKGDRLVINGSEAPIMWSHLHVEPLAAGEHRSIAMEGHDEREFDFWARVVSDEDAHPIANAIVRAIDQRDFEVRADWQAGPVQHIIAGNDDGLIELHLTYSQRFMLHLLVAAPGFGPALFAPLDGHEQREKPMELKLARSGSVEGHVLDLRAKQQSALHARITAESHSLRASDELANVSPIKFSWQSSCDEQGLCTFRNLPSRAHFTVDIYDGEALLLTVPAIPPDWLSLRPGESKRVDWRIGGGTIVHGLALDKNYEPVRKHEIWLLRSAIDAVVNPGPTCSLRPGDAPAVVMRTRTDEQGRFEFASVESGQWLVGIDPMSELEGVDRTQTSESLAVRLEISPGDKEATVTIQPPSTLYVRGRVVTPDGSPTRSARVEMGELEMGPYGTHWMERTTPSADGTFEVGPLRPGTWRIRASAFENYAPSQPVEVEAGTSNVVLRLELAGSFSGVTQGLNLEPESTIYFTMLGRASGVTHWTTRRPGAFRFDGWTPDTYDVAVRSSLGSFAVARGIVVKPGADTTGIVFDLVPGGTITARYRGKAESCYFTLFYDDTEVSWAEVKNGSWKTCPAPTGRVTVRRSTRQGNVDREVIVREGAVTEIELEDR